MIKAVLQILLITFFIILCYDTIDICLNQINSKTEKELLVVKREIEGTKEHVDKSTPYEISYFPIWPIALGFSSAFCSVLCHFMLSTNYLSSKEDVSKVYQCYSLSKFHRAKRNKQDLEEYKDYGDTVKKDDSKHLSNRHFDIRIKDEVVSGRDKGLISSHSSLYQKEKFEAQCSNNSKTDSLAKLNKAGKEESFLNICIPDLFNDEMFPDHSSLNVLNTVSFPPPLTSSEQIDCNNSKRLYSMLLDTKNTNKMRFPVVPTSLYTDENILSKNVSESFYEKSCEILTVNNTIPEEDASQRSSDSNDTIPIQEGHLLGLLSLMNNDIANQPETSTSDKSTSVQLATYSDNDLNCLEKRLETVEYALKRSEEKTKDWGKRINMAETELVDLHEQMYTIFTKFEEEKKTNYIIVSKVSNETMLQKKDRDIINQLGQAEELNEFDQDNVKEENDGTSKNDKEKVSVPASNSGTSMKYSSDEESNDGQSSDVNKSNDEEKPIDESSVKEESFSRELILTELKQRSVALEALLENKSRSQLNPYITKKKIPQLNVPPHIIPPYKRSSFAGTDSKAELRKRRLKLKMHHGQNDIFWGTQI